MSLIDRLIIMVFTLAIRVVIVLTSYEVSKKVQCEADADYVFSYDYSKCVKIGKENVK